MYNLLHVGIIYKQTILICENVSTFHIFMNYLFL
jgi:hypothetical protein